MRSPAWTSPRTWWRSRASGSPPLTRRSGKGVEPLAEFHAMPVLELPWRNRFDAAILYDAMHHFHDEVETLRVIRRALVPGGPDLRPRGSASCARLGGGAGAGRRDGAVRDAGVAVRPRVPRLGAGGGRLRGRFALRGGRRAARRLVARGRAPPRRGAPRVPADEHRHRREPCSGGAPGRRGAVRGPHRGRWIVARPRTTSSPSQFGSRTPAARIGRRTRKARLAWAR